MNIEFFIEDNGNYGAKIVIEKETIFAYGKTLSALEKNMDEGVQSAIIKDSKKADTYKAFLHHFITSKSHHASHA